MAIHPLLAFTPAPSDYLTDRIETAAAYDVRSQFLVITKCLKAIACHLYLTMFGLHVWSGCVLLARLGFISLMSLELVTIYFPNSSYLTLDNSFPEVRKTLGLFWSFC